jgi:general secretion pathway protein B
MSLILDALRKSEAERRRGQVPELHSPGPPVARTPVRRHPAWSWAVAALLIVAGVVAAWFLWSTSRTEHATDADDTMMPPIAGPAPVIPSTAAAPTPTSPASTASAAAMAPAPSTALPRVDAPTASIGSVPLKLPAAQRDAPTVTASPTLPAIAPPAEASAPPQDPALPTLAALPAEQRGALPPLKMSMHVWAEQSAGRFAIIDGQRVGEGAAVSGAVVAGIRRDGVVLEIDGRLYLLPRP